MSFSEVSRAGMLRANVRALTLAAAFVVVILATYSVQAQTYSALHNFARTSGQFPIGGLTRGTGGALYGTTIEGGTGASCKLGRFTRCGTVFRLGQSGKYEVLYNFTGGADGSRPYARLVRDKIGNLYGTTSGGGIFQRPCLDGCGTVFKLDTSGTETVLYSFTGGADGARPGTGLTQDSAGNLYGVTFDGGDTNICQPRGCGVVFKLDTNGTYTVLHTFEYGTDGALPASDLLLTPAGDLYGTTTFGGGLGTVFKFDRTGNYTVLHRFSGNDGSSPAGDMVRDKAGNLYGTTELGGNLTGCNSEGCGVVFELSPKGKYTVLHSFVQTDGENPLGDLILDSAGNLYGTTAFGGVSGSGVLFKLDPTGNYTVLHNFSGADGSFPSGQLVFDRAGNLFGSTRYGGTHHGAGVAFKLTP